MPLCETAARPASRPISRRPLGPGVSTMAPRTADFGPVVFLGSRTGTSANAQWHQSCEPNALASGRRQRKTLLNRGPRLVPSAHNSQVCGHWPDGPAIIVASAVPGSSVEGFWGFVSISGLSGRGRFYVAGSAGLLNSGLRTLPQTQKDKLNFSRLVSSERDSCLSAFSAV